MGRRRKGGVTETEEEAAVTFSQKMRETEIFRVNAEHYGADVERARRI